MLLACGIVLAFAEGFAGRAPIVRDFVGFTYPSRAAWRALFTAGELSTWNPLAELGLSRLAAPVHGALYPGHAFLLAGDLETGVVLTWLVHVAWAGFGGYVLARALGARPFAAVISGAVWSLGGYAVSMAALAFGLLLGSMLVAAMSRSLARSNTAPTLASRA